MKKIFIFIFSIIFFSCSTGKEQVKTKDVVFTVSDYYKIAMEQARKFEASLFIDKKSYTSSIFAFEQVLFIEKLNSDAWYNFGRTLFYGGELKRASDALGNAIRTRPNFAEAYVMLTKCLMADMKKEKAVMLAEKANEMFPENNIISDNLALLYLKLDRLEDAKNISEGIIKDNYKFTPSYITLGSYYYLISKYDMARFMFLKALDLGDDSSSLYTNLGLIYVYTQEPDLALEYFNKAVSKGPGDPYAYLNLASFYMLSGEYNEAIVQIDKGLKFAPNMVELINNKAVSYMYLGLFDESEALFKRAINIDPDFAESYFNYGIFLADHRFENSKAVDMFEKYKSLKRSKLDKENLVNKYIRDIKSRRLKSSSATGGGL